MRTRSSGEDDDHYDSDGDKTVGEDVYDVNFNENFWQTTTSLDDPVVALEEEGEDPDCPCCPASAPVNDYARLLEGCTRFDFCQLTGEQAERMPPPQKLYDGDSGLKRNVANQFQSPLGAFRRAGCTEELVAHWTTNSNR
jgi:hypothetical protein